MICHSGFWGVMRAELPCCALFGKDFSMTYSSHAFPSFPENVVGCAAFCYCFQRKGVRIHTTEIDLRYDLYRHGLDNVLAGGFYTHD